LSGINENYETRACIECGEGYTAFVFPDGKTAGSGLCPACRENHNQATLVMEIKKNKPSLPAPFGSSWTEKSICKKCGAEFQGKYFNLSGNKYGNPRGLCPDCEHEHQLQESELERIEKERLIKVRREAWRYECGIPDEYITKGFASWEFGRPGGVDVMYQTCLDYAMKYNYLRPRENKSLILLSPGAWGIGKTLLASAIAQRILNRWNGEAVGRPVTMITEYGLFRRIRATFNHDNHDQEHETEQKIINTMTRTPLLILDDVGKQEVADPRFVQRVFFEIINERYNYGLPVIITSNKDENALRGYLGGMDGDEATLDRLIEMCDGKFKVFTGESYRRK
jgi:DNA replication protein DnaC